MQAIKITDGRTSLWQWDTGVSIKVYGCTDVDQMHFVTPGGIISRELIGGECGMPDTALQTDGLLKMYAFDRTENGGVTRCDFLLMVKARPKPADYIDPPDEYDNLQALAERVAPLIPGGGGSVSPEQIGAAVEEYLAENPVEGEPGPQGPQGEQGPPGADGSDATVTAESVTAALGYTPADKEAVESLSQEIEDLKGGGGVEIIVPEYTLVEGKYVNVSSQYSSSDTYSMTSEIPLVKGDILRFTTLVRTAAALAKSLGANYYEGLIIEPDYVSAAKSYEYVATENMNVVICQREDTLANVTIERATAAALAYEPKNTRQLLSKKTFNGNMCIKAYKEYRFADGTQPLYKNVLWYDGSGNFYISDDVYSSRVKIFSWDYTLSGGSSAEMYAAHITADGAVLFVFGTQHLSDAASATPGDAHRKNPIIYAPDETDVYTPTEIDFGDALKPTNWLQNVGVITSARHDCIVFCEYTRANEETARVWRVTAPYTDPSNWNVIMQQTVAHPYGEGGFKHFHTVQEDPYNDVIYVTSGDDASSSGCWASTDGGLTFTQVGSYDNAKWRMLNMVFLEDFVYWASDDWTPRHKVWKASRDSNGIIDYASITEVATFPDTSGSSYVATYASVYLACYNAILFLDRCDNDDGIVYLPVNIYDLTAGEMVEVGRIYPADNATYPFLGFRNTAVTLFPRGNQIAMGYDYYYANYNKLLGNIGTHTFATQINNMVMTVARNGDAYSVTYDTVN